MLIEQGAAYAAAIPGDRTPSSGRLLRDDTDYAHHLDYIHYNPAKHGYVTRPGDWPYSSFGRYVRDGIYTADWGHTAPDLPDSVGRE